MAFNVLSAAQRLLVLLELKGGPKFTAEMEAAGSATKYFARQTELAGIASEKTAKKSWLMNQAIFTTRRFAFYGTLAVAGMGAEVIKLGWSYNNAMNQAEVGLQGVIKGQKNLNRELDTLFVIAAKTPFTFQEVVTGFRQMYAGLRPAGVSLDTINKSIVSITDIMSVAGRVTPASLQRVSVALQHMANVGYLTGQAVNQLARDGLQIQPALRKEFHLTEGQLKDIGSMRLSSDSVLKAIIDYAQDPGIRGKALAQATQTLTGAMSTLKDVMSRASGQAQIGMFEGLRKKINEVTMALMPTDTSRKKASFLDIARAFDASFTARTHIILNTFILLESTMKTFVITIYAFTKALQYMLIPLDFLFNLFGMNRVALKLLGYTLGVLLALWLMSTMIIRAYDAAVLILGMRRLPLLIVRLKALALAQEEVNAGMLFGEVVMEKQWANNGLIARGIRWTIDIIVWTYRWAAAIAYLIWENLVVLIRTMVLYVIQAIRVTWVNRAQLIPGFIALTRVLWGVVAAFVAENLAMLGWIGLAIAIVAALIALYIWFKPFRDIVNEVAGFFWKNWYWAGLFLNLVLPGLGLMIWIVGLLVKNWDRLADAIGRVVNIVKKGWHFLGKIIGAVSHAADVGAHGVQVGMRTVLGTPPGKQAGGPISTPGTYMVGEVGPELVYIPSGGHVIPNTQLASSPFPDGFGGGDGRPVVVHVMLDRKVLATAVAQANQDYLARK